MLPIFSSFVGERYVQSLTEDDFVLIYDVNGFIAGMQAVVPVEATLDDAYWPFNESPYYVRDSFFDREVR